MALRKALVVDDSKSARFALRKFLEGREFEVDTAESADEALRYLNSSRPDVIFLDHVMPGMDGFEAMSAMRDNPGTADIAVVICSSNDGDAFAREAADRGAVGVMHKPPSAAKLSEIIGNLKPPRTDAASAPPAAGSDVRQAAERIESAVLAAVRSTLAPEGENTHQLTALGERLDQVSQQLASLDQQLRQQHAALGERLDTLEAAAGQRPDVDHVRDLAREECDALRINLKDEIGELKSALESGKPGTGLEEQLVTLRADFDAFKAGGGSSRDELIQAARAAAAVEAGDVATRTVMNASSKIADRLAESIVASLAANKSD